MRGHDNIVSILAFKVRCEGESSGTAFLHEGQKCSLAGMLFHSWKLFSALYSMCMHLVFMCVGFETN